MHTSADQLNQVVSRAVRQAEKWQLPPNWSRDQWREELLAVAYLAVLKANREYDAKKGVPFEPFAIQRAVSAMLSHFRWEWRYALRNGCTNTDDPEDANLERYPLDPQSDAFVQQIINREVLQRAMCSLTVRERDVLEQIFWLERTEREAASALGMSLRTLHTHKERALAKLRRALEGETALSARSTGQSPGRKAALVLIPRLALLALAAVSLLLFVKQMQDVTVPVPRPIEQAIKRLEQAMARREYEAQERRRKEMLKLDLAIGQQMPMPSTDINENPIQASPAGYKVVFTTADLDPRNYRPMVKWLREDSARDTRVEWIVVCTGTKKQVQQSQRDVPGVHVVWDKKAQLHKRWNAFFYPRAYTVDSFGRLKHMTYLVEPRMLFKD